MNVIGNPWFIILFTCGVAALLVRQVNRSVLGRPVFAKKLPPPMPRSESSIYTGAHETGEPK